MGAILISYPKVWSCLELSMTLEFQHQPISVAQAISSFGWVSEKNSADREWYGNFHNYLSRRLGCLDLLLPRTSRTLLLGDYLILGKTFKLLEKAHTAVRFGQFFNSVLIEK